MIKTIIAFCPSCKTRICFDDPPRLRDIVVCSECLEQLDVVRLSPLTLDRSTSAFNEIWPDFDFDDYGDYRDARQNPYDFD